MVSRDLEFDQLSEKVHGIAERGVGAEDGEEWESRLNYLLRSIYKAGARAQLDYSRRKQLDPVDRLRWLAGQGFGDDIREVLSEVEDWREKADRITGAYGITDSELRSWISEGLHTAFRKGADHPYAVVIHQLIKDMPPGEWSGIVDFVANPLVTWLREAQAQHESQQVEEKKSD